MKTIVAAAALFLAVFAGGRLAHAQTAGTTGTTTTTGSFTSTDFFITIQAENGVNLSTYDLARFFNKRNCDCTQDVFVRAAVASTGFAKRGTAPTGTFSVLVGSLCDQILYRGSCATIASDQLGTFLAEGSVTIPTNARVMSTQTVAQTSPDGGTTGGGTFVATDSCTSTTNGFNQTVWILIDYGADGTADVVTTLPVFVDLTPPPPPVAEAVTPGNEAVIVAWTPLDFATNMDLAGYQVLCRRGANTVVFSPGTFTPYVRSCPATRVGTGPEALDPDYVCSPLLTKSTSNFRVKILQNDIVYGATVVAVDNSGNASLPTVLEARPTKTMSFYDYYRDGNITNGAAGQTSMPGEANGGFCAVASQPLGRGRPLAGAGVAAAAAVALVLRARRRGRRS